MRYEIESVNCATVKPITECYPQLEKYNLETQQREITGLTTLKTFIHYRHYITLESLEQLNKLMIEVGHDLIIGEEADGVPVITIYDGYIE